MAGKKVRRPASKGRKSRKARKAKARSQFNIWRKSVDKFKRDFGVSGKISNEKLRAAISAAAVGKASFLNEEVVRSFWAVTREIWNRDDVPADKRYEAIMKAAGTDNLADAIGWALWQASTAFSTETGGRALPLGRYGITRLFGYGFFPVAQ